MHRLAASSVVLIILQSVLSVVANVKITPIAVESKGSLKSDLKVEEARYRDPVVPEYYGNSYDRNRQNFVTSNYGSYAGLSSYDRNGYSSGYGSNNDRYGSQWNRDRVSGYGASPMNPMDKVNYMAGGVYNPGSSINSYGSSIGGAPGFGNNYGGGSGYGNSGYGGRFPIEGGSINGPYPSQGGGPLQGMFPPDLEGKSSLILPLAGAALLGIAAYALVASPAMAMGPMIGKRRKRSLFDEKLEQHMAYRAHRKPVKQV